jgi:hypothetical protein
MNNLQSLSTAALTQVFDYGDDLVDVPEDTCTQAETFVTPARKTVLSEPPELKRVKQVADDLQAKSKRTRELFEEEEVHTGFVTPARKPSANVSAPKRVRIKANEILDLQTRYQRNNDLIEEALSSGDTLPIMPNMEPMNDNTGNRVLRPSGISVNDPIRFLLEMILPFEKSNGLFSKNIHHVYEDILAAIQLYSSEYLFKVFQVIPLYVKISLCTHPYWKFINECLDYGKGASHHLLVFMISLDSKDAPCRRFVKDYFTAKPSAASIVNKLEQTVTQEVKYEFVSYSDKTCSTKIILENKAKHPYLDGIETANSYLIEQIKNENPMLVPALKLPSSLKLSLHNYELEVQDE